ncbi:MAG: hypothetical protein ABIT01_19150 [Thermoanaerobaculia bacterium]
MKRHPSGRFAPLFLLLATAGPLLAEGERIPLRDWPVNESWTAETPDHAAASLTGIAPLSVPTQPLTFVAIAPCRVADTRDASYPAGYGPPSLPGGSTRNFTLWGRCGIPTTAQAVSFNFTVVNTTGDGFLQAYPQGSVAPTVSTLNFVAGQVVANAAIAPLGTGGGLTTVAGVSGFNLIFDVNGYFFAEPVSSARTVWVGPVGTAAQNGSALLTALAGISGNSSTNGWLLKIEPGIYDLGSTPLAMKPYIDVEGSGEGVTTVQMSSCPNGVVQGADNAELRLLTVQCLGGGTGINGIAIRATNVSTRITRVTALSSTPTSGIGTAISLTGAATPVLTDVKATTTSGGSQTIGIGVSGGSTVVMRRVQARVAGAGSSISDTAISMTDGAPLLEGVSAIVVLSSGTTAIGIANAGNVATERNVTASASGASSSYGIVNGFGNINPGGASPLIVDSTADAYATNTGYGIWNIGSTPTLSNVTASARNAVTFNDGMHSEQSSIITVIGGSYTSQGGTGSAITNSDTSGTVSNAVLLSATGSSHWGLYNSASSARTLLVTNSRIQGSTATIQNFSNCTTRIGASQLDGGAVSNSGTLSCAGVFDESFAFFPSTCP